MTKNSSILVVDDNVSSLRLIQKIFSKQEYQVETLPSGELALESIELHTPDLILLDINLPGINGYEVCKRIKADERFADIPIIFLSGMMETLDKVKAFEVGGVDYIGKPYHHQELMARIQTHLELSRTKSHLEQKNYELEKALKQLKETQGVLVQSEKMAALGVLTAGIAHEINNPINYINASCQGLRKVCEKLTSLSETLLDAQKNDIAGENQQSGYFTDLTTQAHELLENISNGSKRATEIVKSLKTFSHGNRSQRELFDIHLGLDSTIALIKHKLNGTIQVEKIYSEVPPIYCFPGMLNQVFLNVLTNAVDAIKAKESNEGNKITVKTLLIKNKDQPDIVEISVQDTGIGMDKDVREHIFEPFYTTKDVGQGTGLGMSISYNLVKEHQGHIIIHSEPHVGSNVIVKIPVLH